MKSYHIELIKYAINGLIATAVHYLTLVLNIEYFGFGSKGLANGTAALVGITVSFLGNKYFVFSESEGDLGPQVLKFAALYAVAAAIHGAGLWLWSDLASLNYSIGFVILTGFQVLISYFGNKYFVFDRPSAAASKKSGP